MFKQVQNLSQEMAVSEESLAISAVSSLVNRDQY